MVQTEETPEPTIAPSRTPILASDPTPESLLAAAEAAGGPIFEEVEGDNSLVDATLVAEAPPGAEAVMLFGALCRPSNLRRMERIGDSAVWAIGVRVPVDLCTAYAFAPVSAETAGAPSVPRVRPSEWQSIEEIERFVSGMMSLFSTLQADPRNRRGSARLGDQGEDRVQRSAFEGPGAGPARELTRRPGVPTGTVTEHLLPSRFMREEVQVWLHIPGSWDGSAELGLLVEFDGQKHLTQPWTAIVDNLNTEGVEPFATVFVDSGPLPARRRALGLNDDFVDFIAHELVPWVGKRVPRADDPARTVVDGASLGGIAAMHTATRHPDVFGGFQAQSPTLNLSRDGEAGSMFGVVERAAELPQRASIQLGRLETFILPRARRMRDLLRSRGLEVLYRETMNAHDFFVATAADGLRFLLRRE